MAEPKSQSTAQNRPAQREEVSCSFTALIDCLRADPKDLEHEEVSDTFKAFMDDLRANARKKP
jgi:hypothetical protein